MGVAPTTFSNYVTGVSKIPYDMLLKLADYFHVTTDYLVGLTDIPTIPFRLTAEEQEMMTDYRMLKSEYQGLVLKNLKNILDLQSVQEKHT